LRHQGHVTGHMTVGLLIIEINHTVNIWAIQSGIFTQMIPQTGLIHTTIIYMEIYLS